MSIIFNDNIAKKVPKALDDQSGVFESGVWRPWNTTNEALTSGKLLPEYRNVGLTITVLKAGVNTEYWFRDGIEDNDLIEKSSSSGGSDLQSVLTAGNSADKAIHLTENTESNQPDVNLPINRGIWLDSYNYDGGIGGRLTLINPVGFDVNEGSAVSIRMQVNDYTAPNSLIQFNIGEGIVAFRDPSLVSSLGVVAEFSDRVIGVTGINANEFTTKEYVDSQSVIQALNEGSGIGYRLRSSNPIFFKNIGVGAFDVSHAESGTDAYGASGAFSFTSGRGVNASGICAFSIGDFTSATAQHSVSMGRLTTANGAGSVAMGNGNVVNTPYGFAVGNYNNDTGDLFFMIGNGTGVSTRSNAYQISVLGKTKQIGIAEYATDLSSSYTARTFVDKGYVGANFAGLDTDNVFSGANSFTDGTNTVTIHPMYLRARSTFLDSNVDVTAQNIIYAQGAFVQSLGNEILTADRNCRLPNASGQVALKEGGLYSFTADGTSTVYTFPHGMTSIPKVVIVTRGDLTDYTEFKTSRDATNITVTYQSPPAAGSTTLNWLAIL